jgi:16S rRNA (guanine966-N2)-methyltransferase
MATTSKSNVLRIVGGQWRSRKIAFPDVEGLRPTPDRVRETVFNWLQPIIAGSVCLDLFAGSGAMGFEALSRGAARVVMLDADARAIASLRENARTLRTDAAEIVHVDALAYLRGVPPARPFDIVFVDPPYHRDLVNPCLELLGAGPWLARNPQIFIEAERDLKSFHLPAGLALERSKTAGQVGYHLARPPA